MAEWPLDTDLVTENTHFATLTASNQSSAGADPFSADSWSLLESLDPYYFIQSDPVTLYEEEKTPARLIDALEYPEQKPLIDHGASAAEANQLVGTLDSLRWTIDSFRAEWEQQQFVSDALKGAFADRLWAVAKDVSELKETIRDEPADFAYQVNATLEKLSDLRSLSFQPEVTVPIAESGQKRRFERFVSPEQSYAISPDFPPSSMKPQDIHDTLHVEQQKEPADGIDLDASLSQTSRSGR